jgi:hypothetical protein
MSGAFQPQCIEISPNSAQCRAMNTSWKAIWLAALGTMCVAVVADAQENPPTGDRTLTVLVGDYAGLSESSRNELESLSAALLSHAGIRITLADALHQALDLERFGAQPAQARKRPVQHVIAALELAAGFDAAVSNLGTGPLDLPSTLFRITWGVM